MRIREYIGTAALVMTLFLTGANLHAQTAVKKTTTKTTVKAKPKTTGKKRAKAGTIFVCDGVNSYTYHSRRSCASLNKCKGRVLEMTPAEAKSSWAKKPCKECH